ncbi:MAG: hypothetical protein ACRYGC_13060 [Janthinobacterium lividum]
MPHRSHLRAALLAGSALAWSATGGGARAAEDPRLGAIEAQIRALQAQLGQVRHDLAARDAQVRSARAEAAQARAEARAATAAHGRGDALAQGPSGGAPAAAQPVRLAASPGGDAGPPAANGVVANAPGTVGQQQAGAVGGPSGTFRVGNATVTLGGFVALEGIWRSRNETADIASNFNTGIPLRQAQAAHENEFRFTARQSRLSLLVADDPTPSVHLAGFLEADFLGAASNSNSLETNSYVPRLRQIYGTFDDKASGWHVLAGQAWSLATLDKVGITPRQEAIPLTVDLQFVPGFNWTRQPQLRVTKDLDDHRIWLAASLENPQGSFYVGPNGAGVAGATVNTGNPGGTGFYSDSSYSADVAPDVIVKAAFDPGWGHYEAYGIARFLRSRVSTVGSGHNDVTLAGGGGAGLIVPLLPGTLNFRASGLAGYGIGRYASGQLPDATLSASGSPDPLPEVEALIGLEGHAGRQFDLYGYIGTEQIARRSFTAGGRPFGYGNALYGNAGCGTELSTATCVANTSGITQGTLGGWWRFYQGGFGTVQGGVQYSYTRRDIFQGVGGHAGTDENTVLTSLRFSPFQ